MKHKLVILYMLFIALTSCSTFIPDEEYEKLKLIDQSGEYIVIDNFERNGIKLAKNEVVKLIVLPGDEWIKVYAYNSEEGLLASNRALILYMFDSDFPDKKFDRVIFNNELLKTVKPKITSTKPEKKVKKIKRKKG